MTVMRLSLFPRSQAGQLSATHLLRSAVNLAAGITRFRDADTGMHLERVSHYARLIARALPPTEGLDDAFIDDLLFFAPVHDIGKVAIPDHILLKP
jgi:response regulator RpfG family c-di-GMP phosphodiesterase